MLYLQLFWEFFKTGLFAVGGGLATLPFLQDMADRTGWFTHAQLADMLAVSESTPGPIGVNMATYVGFTTGTQLVHTSSTAASAMAGQFRAAKPVMPLCSRAMGTTEMPAAATRAVEAGRRP